MIEALVDRIGFPIVDLVSDIFCSKRDSSLEKKKR